MFKPTVQNVIGCFRNVTWQVAGLVDEYCAGQQVYWQQANSSCATVKGL